MSVSRIAFQLTAVSGPVLDYLRFMSGREIRSRVLQGGNQNEMAVLRMGGHLIKARIQGASITSGSTLFVRVVPKGKGFTLLVLGDGETTPPRPSEISKDISREIYEKYLKFLGKEEPLRETERPQEQRSRDQERPQEQRSREQDRPQEQRSREQERPQEQQERLQEQERLQDQERPQEQERLRDDESEKHERQHEEMPFWYTGGEVNLDSRPVYCFLKLQTPRLGEIGIMIQSQSRDFNAMSVYLTPKEPKTAALMQAILEEWRETLASWNLGITEIALLPAESKKYSGGIDLTA